MNCEEVRELSGAYALGALSPEELREVEAHLAECNLHEEMAALRATAALLAFAPSRSVSRRSSCGRASWRPSERQTSACPRRSRLPSRSVLVRHVGSA